MRQHKKIAAAVAAMLTAMVGVGLALAQPAPGPMSFFLTSRGSGNGGNLGGLDGADRICQDLAQAAGHGALTWRAYLSTQGQNAVNARDRIGPGPWFNVRGARIAQNVDELHTLGEPHGCVHGARRAWQPDSGQRFLAEQARHPDGLDARGQGVPGRRGHDVRQLDEQQR